MINIIMATENDWKDGNAVMVEAYLPDNRTRPDRFFFPVIESAIIYTLSLYFAGKHTTITASLPNGLSVITMWGQPL